MSSHASSTPGTGHSWRLPTAPGRALGSLLALQLCLGAGIAVVTTLHRKGALPRGCDQAKPSPNGRCRELDTTDLPAPENVRDVEFTTVIMGPTR